MDGTGSGGRRWIRRELSHRRVITVCQLASVSTLNINRPHGWLLVFMYSAFSIIIPLRYIIIIIIMDMCEPGENEEGRVNHETSCSILMYVYFDVRPNSCVSVSYGREYWLGRHGVCGSQRIVSTMYWLGGKEICIWIILRMAIDMTMML